MFIIVYPWNLTFVSQALQAHSLSTRQETAEQKEARLVTEAWKSTSAPDRKHQPTLSWPYNHPNMDRKMLNRLLEVSLIKQFASLP